MTPSPQAALDRLAERFPSFEQEEGYSRSIKTVVVKGRYRGAAAIAKVLERDEPVWRWYHEREIRLYAAFEHHPPPVVVPRLLASAPGIMIIDRRPGTALTPGRATKTPIGESAMCALLQHTEAINRWKCPDPRWPPSPGVTAEMRRRLLEDPSAPRAWFLEGLIRCVDLDILSADDAERMDALIRALPVRSCHGDLLLRNALWDGEALSLIDWECAGPHPMHWDRALLWACLLPEEREALEAHVLKTHASTSAGFYACVAWALAREIKFSRGRRALLHREAMEQVQSKLR